MDGYLGAITLGGAYSRSSRKSVLAIYRWHIKALDEGTKVPMKVPVLTITNTQPEFFWLVNYLETVLSAELWKASTNATIAHHYRLICERWARKPVAI